jgi:hypothetical protein
MLRFAVAGVVMIKGVVVACTGDDGLQGGERHW